MRRGVFLKALIRCSPGVLHSHIVVVGRTVEFRLAFRVFPHWGGRQGLPTRLMPQRRTQAPATAIGSSLAKGAGLAGLSFWILALSGREIC